MSEGLKQLSDAVGGYYVYSNNAQSGPFPKSVLQEMRSNGTLTDQSYVAIDGEWVLASNILWEPTIVLDPQAPSAASGPEPVLTAKLADQEPEPEEEEPSVQFTEEDRSLLEEVALSGKMATCPHCWHQFDMSMVNYISRHPDLLGDPVVGPGEPRRFLPTKFNSQGYAIDAKGMVCNEMACPKCHLPLPLSSTELPSSMFSIVGAPASGKSYYLTSSIWMMRYTLAQKFDISLADTDETFNAVLNNYESLLFLNNQSDRLVSLPKTEVTGADYTNQITMNGVVTDLPKPFIFTLNPSPAHPEYGNKDSHLLRNIVLYDNGGEHFEPGRDSVNNPSTHHLIYSDSIVFLYDPMKDIRLASKCDRADPQLKQRQYKGNQQVLLNEMIARIRKYSGLNSREKYNKMFIMVIPKYDAWKEVFPMDLANTEFTMYSESDMKYYLDLSAITNVSYILRNMMLKTMPDVVSTCESFFSTVYYLPVSALGKIPEYDEKNETIGIHPEHLKPVWAEVPMLLQFWYSGLIEGVAPFYKDSIPIENYKFVGDSLIYSIPGHNGRFSVPSNYWGRTVYNETAKSFITFPDNQTEETAADSGPANKSSAGDDDFWN